MKNLDKYCYILLLVLFLAGHKTRSQDLPLFSQKLTNSFMYNPSVAGSELGSVTLSSRTYWWGTQGAPFTNFLSAHMPFDYQKMGVGVNLVSERIGVYNNLYANGAYAYHLRFSEDMLLSMGLSAEYIFMSINERRLNALHTADPLLTEYNTRHNVDFSFGTSFRYRFLKVGLSSNRLATALRLTGDNSLLTQYYTGFLNAELPLSRAHKIEPTFVYRRLTDLADKWEAGMYYSFKDAIILGGSYSAGGMIHATAGLRFKDRFLVGYSFEMFSIGGVQREIGGTNEITLRMDIRDDSYYKNVRNSPDVLEKSIVFKRKKMGGRLGSKPTSASSDKYQKRLKRNYIRNPNYRIETSDNKLENKRRSKNITENNSKTKKEDPQTKPVKKPKEVNTGTSREAKVAEAKPTRSGTTRKKVVEAKPARSSSRKSKVVQAKPSRNSGASSKKVKKPPQTRSKSASRSPKKRKSRSSGNKRKR